MKNACVENEQKKIFVQYNRVFHVQKSHFRVAMQLQRGHFQATSKNKPLRHLLFNILFTGTICGENNLRNCAFLSIQNKTRCNCLHPYTLHSCKVHCIRPKIADICRLFYRVSCTLRSFDLTKDKFASSLLMFCVAASCQK